MGSQINFYLPKSDIKKIENYLKNKGFVFVKDTILSEPKPVFVPHLWNTSETAKYVTLPKITFEYRQFEENGIPKYRIQPLSALAMQFSFFGMQNDLYRFRFYYRPSYFNNGIKITKSVDFEVFVREFFTWTQINFQAVNEMPDFYYNPTFPVEVAF